MVEAVLGDGSVVEEARHGNQRPAVPCWKGSARPSTSCGMSGIATLTHAYVARVAGTGAVIPPEKSPDCVADKEDVGRVDGPQPSYGTFDRSAKGQPH